MPQKQLYPLILLADNDHEVIKQLSSYLCENKFRVLAAVTSKQALGLAFNKKPDMIIIDFMITEIDGPTFRDLIAVNPETFNIPVLFTVNATSQKEPSKWRHISENDIISKPFETNELLSKIYSKLKKKNKKINPVSLKVV
ncbi:MAG: response regulator [Bacteroidota bacterium]